MCTHRSCQVNTYYIYSLQGRHHYDHTPLNGSISCYDSWIVKYLKYIFVSIATPDIYIAPDSYMLPWRHRAINNTLWPRQDDCHFADDIFKFIFLSENVWVSLKISLKFVPKVRVNNVPSPVQRMAWRRSRGKPLPEPMMVSLFMYICVTRS